MPLGGMGRMGGLMGMAMRNQAMQNRNMNFRGSFGSGGLDYDDGSLPPPTNTTPFRTVSNTNMNWNAPGNRGNPRMAAGGRNVFGSYFNYAAGGWRPNAPGYSGSPAVGPTTWVRDPSAPGGFVPRPLAMGPGGGGRSISGGGLFNPYTGGYDHPFAASGGGERGVAQVSLQRQNLF